MSYPERTQSTVPHNTDLDLTGRDIARLTSVDALASFFARLGYDTGTRAMLTPEAIGLPAGATGPIKQIELLSEDPEGLFLRVVFVQLGSLTAKSCNDLARVLGRTNIDHLLVLASDFEILEFVLLDKQRGERRGVAGGPRVQVVPRTFSVDRRAPDRLQVRPLRRLTWTCRDGLEQYEKLRAVFEAPAFTEEYFQNRALFADHYLNDRLREQPAWQDNPSEIFHNVKPLLHDAHYRLFGKGEDVARHELYEPIFRLLGFQPKVNKSAASDQTRPDYLLKNDSGKPMTAAFVYAWGRWLDGPDFNDQNTPEENPGACVVSALDEGTYDWIVVTNGRLWRLYSRRAHSRATNFYEVDLAEALAIDRLARDRDEKTYSLVFIDYKSLEVRHLGSIYEGLLEFKLKMAAEDLTTKTEKKREKYIPLAKAKPRRGKTAQVAVRKGEVYLSNDKSERKATGSYYTPDPIVEYIVEHTVGPVLDEKLEALRPKFRKVRRTFNRELEKARAYPVKRPSGETWDAREFALEKVYAEHKDLFEELFEFRTLDPAMGSGHFLVEAVDFITDRVLGFLNQFPVNPVSVALDRTRRNILEALGEQGVSVDAAKLTEVNLLKRHVLKRCIYGVDINPMAVELAKVSLWLDAFTLGAPLSFLDHHLRCGNSLIGATFEDLEKATEGQLFGIDYQPLIRAIHHVLFVNKMADATAAEAKRSADEYDQAREELSGYQIVLDLLVAEHFGVSDVARLLVMGELDLSSRTAGRQSLSDVTELGLVEKVEGLARRADLRFFHWEVEFPEVFFGFKDANQRQIEHKDQIAEGTAGFDAILGNPPYVRQEAIRELKPHLRATYDSYHAVADLFVYLYDRACCSARRNGRIGFISSGSWVFSNFGGALRRLLSRNAAVESMIDFGEFQPFEGAEMIRPTITVLRWRARGGEMRLFRWLTCGEPPRDLTVAIADGTTMRTDHLGQKGRATLCPAPRRIRSSRWFSTGIRSGSPPPPVCGATGFREE